MRHMLLCGAAALGATVFASAASAQDLPPVYTQGVPGKPGPVQGANDSNNYQAASLPGGVANPVPGSLVVRFNGRVLGYGYIEGNSFDTSGPLGGNTAAGIAATGTPAKLQKYGFYEYSRLYAGVDGLAANGLKYGAAIEVRTNGGPTNGSSSNDGSSANSRSSTLYIRREFAYMGTDQVGIIRYGATDGVLGIFDNGVTTFQNFDNGAWNGDLPGMLPANAQVAFPFFSQQGSDYDNGKLVYLSPQFAGFDLGLQFAPSSSQDNQDAGPITTNTLTVSSTSGSYPTLNAQLCAIAASGCPNLASSSASNDGARFKNQYAAGVRYQNRIGDLALYGYAGYMGSGHVDYTGPAAFQRYNGLALGDFGGAVTYAGLTIGGHYMVGSFNGVGALRPVGGAQGETWLGGIQYAIGPFTAGASYYDFTSQGSPNLVNLSQRHETALAAGTTYSIAPGLSLFTSYLYGTRHQGGFDFQTGAAATAKTIDEKGAATSTYNSVQAQVFAVGTIVKW